jgi:hypothetical protein
MLSGCELSLLLNFQISDHREVIVPPSDGVGS